MFITTVQLSHCQTKTTTPPPSNIKKFYFVDEYSFFSFFIVCLFSYMCDKIQGLSSCNIAVLASHPFVEKEYCTVSLSLTFHLSRGRIPSIYPPPPSPPFGEEYRLKGVLSPSPTLSSGRIPSQGCNLSIPPPPPSVSLEKEYHLKGVLSLSSPPPLLEED